MLTRATKRDWSAGHEEVGSLSPASLEGCVKEAFLSVGGSRRLRFLEMTYLPELVSRGESISKGDREQKTDQDQGKGLVEGSPRHGGESRQFSQPTQAPRHKTTSALGQAACLAL